jgi:hypothetical protein
VSLPYGAELTIGGTINLGNYENIRFEVKSPIRDNSDFEELIGGWSDALGRLGRGDPQTAAAVDSFIRRVIGTPAEVPTPEGVPAAPTPAPKAAAEPKRIPVSEVKPVKPEPPTPKPAGEKPICTQCGKEISEKEKRTSQLFVGAAMCDQCSKAKAAPPEGSR